MKTLVTGGFGFIGSHVVERLLTQGWQTVVLDNSMAGREENLLSCKNSTRLRVVEGDIREPRDIQKAMTGVEVVVHLAALVSVSRSVDDPTLTEEINVGGTFKLLDACVENKVRRFVFASTAAVYGGAAPSSETETLVPLSPYAASKIEAESYCKKISGTRLLEAAILRFFNVYGPRMGAGPYAGVMAKFAQAVKTKGPFVIFGDGNQTRDFVYVDDIVDAILLTMNKPNLHGEVFNIGTGVGTSVNELAKFFVQASGGEERKIVYGIPRKGDVRQSIADITKARRELGYKPRIPLEQGVTNYLSWFLGAKDSRTST
jgi:UDP-N-acetylglucosamine/UDP-N-acetyl-alpha-D-glucosaminouronate 4-epimerase